MKISYEIKETFGVITLDNPPYNTLTSPVFAESATLKAFLEQPTITGVVVQGAGRHFCGGADLDSLQKAGQRPEELSAQLDMGKSLLDTIVYATIPVVAVVRGSCLGAGLEIALACHFRIAAPNALFGFPETHHGLMPGMGGSIAVAEILKGRHAIELLLSGRLIGGDEAIEVGLVDRIFSQKTLLPEAMRFLHSLTDHRSVRQIRSIMQSIHNARLLSRQEALHQETLFFESLVRNLKPESIRSLV